MNDALNLLGLSKKFGGAPWLMRDELPLFSRDVGASGGPATHARAIPPTLLWWAGIIYLLLHVVAWGLLRTQPLLQDNGSATQLHHAGACALVLFTVMLSGALARSVRVIAKRRDMDLLLSSPVSARPILEARLGGIVLGMLMVCLFLLTPIANMGLLRGQPQWLALYPALAALAAIAGGMGMAATLVLVKFIGTRGAGVMAKIFSALTSLVLYFSLFQWNMAQPAVMAALWHQPEEVAALGRSSPLWWPARALIGEPWPLLLMCLLATGVLWLTPRLLQRAFVRALQLGGASAAVPPQAV